MKNVFYFTLKALFLRKKFLSFCPDIFGPVERRLDKKDKISFKIYDIINWETIDYNTHVSQISRGKGNQAVKFGQLIEYNRNIFLEKSYTNVVDQSQTFF